MSRRKPSAPQKRKIKKEEEDPIPDLNATLEEIREHGANFMYPKFQVFKSELAAYYLLDSEEEILELTFLFGERRNKGTKNKRWFGDRICNWRLCYKSDIDKYKKEIIQLINLGCKLMDIGLQVKLSNNPKAGYGLFATKNFAENDVLTRYGGYYCNMNFFETHARPKDEATYVFQFLEEDGFGILNSETYFKLGFEMGRWVNSIEEEKQNVRPAVEIPENAPPMLSFLARRDIQAGEELYWWYGESYGEFIDSCIMCFKASTQKCDSCKIPICGSICWDNHLEKAH